MNGKEYRHLEFIGENVSLEDKKYYRSYIYKDENGGMVIDKKEISQKTFKDTTEKKSFTGVLHSLIMAARNLFDRACKEKDLSIIKNIGKQLNYYLDKLVFYAEKNNICKDELSQLLVSAMHEALQMTKKHCHNGAELEFLQNAFSEIINSSELKNFYNIPNIETEIE